MTHELTDERTQTLVNSLRASKGWATAYAEAFVAEYLLSQAGQETVYIDAGHLREVLNGNDMPAFCSAENKDGTLMALYLTPQPAPVPPPPPKERK